MSQQRDGELAVVTGASSGIGEATAAALVAEGWRVVAIARGHDKLDALAERLADSPGEVIIESADAADGEAMDDIAKRVLAEHGAPALIVNSAGAGQWKFIEDTLPGEAAQMMAAPYLAAFETTRAFMASLLERRRGVIVHVGSPASTLTWPGAAGYTAARWALRGLHESLSQDLRRTGVHSCHAVFGKVTTAYFETNPDSEEHIPGVANMIRVLPPEECARVIVSLARRPRRFVAYPFMLRVFYWMNALAPWAVRWLTYRTGRRH